MKLSSNENNMSANDQAVIMAAGGCCGEALSSFEFYDVSAATWTISEASLVYGRSGNGLVQVNL